MTHEIDGGLVRERRIDLGLSQRALGAAVGGNGMTVQRLEDASDTDDFPLSLARSLARALAVDFGQLLGAEPLRRDGAEESAQIVGRLIASSCSPLARPHLLEALGWDNERLDDALSTLSGSLATTGQALRETTAGMSICAAHDPGPISHERQSVAAQRATAQLRRLGLLDDVGDAHVLSEDVRFSLMLDL